MTRNTTPILRRKFFRFLGGLFTAPFFVFAGIAVKKTEKNHATGRLVLSGVPEGVSFHGAVITVREGERLLVLSSRCTHLGCRIRTLRDGRLLCPCHGSEFTTEGNVIKGPAGDPLISLAYKRDPDTGTLAIYLNRQA